MTVTVTPLTKPQARSLLEQMKVVNRMSAELLANMQSQGWYIAHDYSMEIKHEGFFIVIEFCLGDFCVYPCSKKGHWLLEKKQSFETFNEALVAAALLKVKIDRGFHWQGENN